MTAAVLAFDTSGITPAAVRDLRRLVFGDGHAPISDRRLVAFFLAACGAAGSPRLRCGYRWPGPTPAEQRSSLQQQGAASSGEAEAQASGYDSAEDPESPFGARPWRGRCPSTSAVPAGASGSAAAPAGAALEDADAGSSAADEREATDAAAALGSTWVEHAVSRATGSLRPSDALFRGYPARLRREAWGERVLRRLGWRDVLARRGAAEAAAFGGGGGEGAGDAGGGGGGGAIWEDPWGSTDDERGATEDEEDGLGVPAWGGGVAAAWWGGDDAGGGIRAAVRRERARLRAQLRPDSVWEACQARARSSPCLV